MTLCTLLGSFPTLLRLCPLANDLVDSTGLLGFSPTRFPEFFTQASNALILSGRTALGLLIAVLRLSVLLGLRG
jgi:hypothetical protein